MSGGHYDYKCFEVGQFGEMVEADAIGRSVDQEIDQGGYTATRKALPADIINKMKTLAAVLKQCGTACRDLEWFMSGDIGEDAFRESSHKALTEIGKTIEQHYQV